MDPLGIQAALKAVPAEAQPLIKMLMDRMDALEAQTAKDAQALAAQIDAAVEKVIAALVPQAQAMTQTVNAVADQAMTLLRRLDGASIHLGPS